MENKKPAGFSHSFDVGYAIAYGVDEAIMIATFQHFIRANAARKHNFREGRYWTYDTLSALTKHFPYWSVKQVRRIVKSLIEKQVILSGSFAEHWSDRTSWYAFVDESKFLFFGIPETGRLEHPSRLVDRCPNETLPSDQVGTCIYDYSINSSINSSILRESSLKVSCETVAAEAAEVEVARASNTKSVRKATEFSLQIKQLTEQMIDTLIKHEPEYKAPKNLAPFMTEVDYMIRLDDREPGKIVEVLNWALADSFWKDKLFKPNPAKYLREKYLQLKNKMEAPPPKVDRKFAPSSDYNSALRTLEEMNKRAL